MSTATLVLNIDQFWIFEMVVTSGRYDLVFPRHVCHNRIIWGD